MKKINTWYWVVTGLMSAFMMLGAWMDILKVPNAVDIIKHLGYPEYFIRFIGIMKILGVITVLIPGFPKLKEWAYAGLVFDTLGALFSHLSTGDSPDKWLPALLGFLLVMGSYVIYTRRNNLNIN